MSRVISATVTKATMEWIVRSTLMSVCHHPAKTVPHVYNVRTQHEMDLTYRMQRDTIASARPDLQVHVKMLFYDAIYSSTVYAVLYTHLIYKVNALLFKCLRINLS